MPAFSAHISMAPDWLSRPGRPEVGSAPRKLRRRTLSLQQSRRTSMPRTYAPISWPGSRSFWTTLFCNEAICIHRVLRLHEARGARMQRILYAGTKNASSWSLRAWLALKEAGVEFEERVVDIRRPQR